MRLTTPETGNFSREEKESPEVIAMRKRLDMLEARDGFEQPVDRQEPVVDMAMQQNVQALDLPSKYMFYGKKTSISVRDILFRELMLISTHQQSNSFRSLAEAISNTVLNHDGMHLSFGDFQYILYYQRHQIEKKWEVQWTCVDEAHIAATQQEDEPLPVESLTNIMAVKHTTFEYINPKVDIIETLRSSKGELLMDGEPVVNKLGQKIYVGPFTTSDFADMIEEDATLIEDGRGAGALNLDALALTRSQNALASYIVRTPDNDKPTLKEKRKFLEKWFDNAEPNHKYQSEVIRTIFKFGDACAHGVNEYAKVKCGVCGCEAVKQIVVDPADFFPEI